jgi:DNA processing protein
MEKRDFCLGLSLIKGVGPIVAARILDRFSSADKLLSASPDELASIESLNRETAKNILSFNWSKEVEKEKEKLIKNGADLLSILDNDYPESLKSIYAPPIIIYKKGNIIPEDSISVAMVGSRVPTPYGLRMAKKIADGLAERGVTVISGMARGIDTETHKSSLKRGGRTIAVLGCGIDVIYPPENRKLAKDIIERGALISEFSMGSKPDRGNFPRRNRIISGLTLGTVVVEAAEKSGAIITANYALEQGKEVYAVPGEVSSLKSRGTNRLIKTGAKLVEDAEDIIEDFPSSIKKKLNNRDNSDFIEISLDEEEKRVYNSITESGSHIDNIVDISGLPAGRVSAILLKLEIRGAVKKVSGLVHKS